MDTRSVRLAPLLAALVLAGCAPGRHPQSPATSDSTAMSHDSPTTLTPEQQRALLAPYRARLDVLDAQIVDLLGKRFDIIREVAALKAEHGIPPILPDRIEEVVARAKAKAAQAGLDPKLAEQIYRIIIDEACRQEEAYAHGARTAR